MKSPLAYVFIGIVKAYRAVISPMSGPRCKYYPTCSTYSLTALQRHGAIKGGLLSMWRIMRCNPWSLGGVDKVPLKGQWKAEPLYQMSDEELRAYWSELDKAQEQTQGHSYDLLVEEQARRNLERAQSVAGTTTRSSQ